MTETKACIIGAGSSGIAAAKVLSERGIPFDCFEMGPDIGGLWNYENDTGRSPAYRSLHTNTSRSLTAYSDFPMPSSYPDFPHHSQMLEYFRAYVDHFKLRPKITFRTRVEGVVPVDGDRYRVTVYSLNNDETTTNEYGAVVVASGHHWNPNRPSLPGSFDGVEMHSHSYRTPDVAEGKRVLVVGVGNSACDIVCELAGVTERALLSTRRGAHVIPKYLLGRPLDTWLSPLSSRLPFAFQRAVFRALIFLTQGRQSKYGFPAPGYPLGSEHPSISSHLLPLVERGKIIPKPDIERLDGDGVRFVDGTREAVDVIVYATGYVVSFPFLDFIEPRDNYLPLYRHVVHPEHPNLYFLGLIQPLGPLPPLAEAQAEWAADLIRGEAALPPVEKMWAAIHKEDEERRRRFVDSKRHRMEVDFYRYLAAIRRERKQGRRLALERASSPREAIPA